MALGSAAWVYPSSTRLLLFLLVGIPAALKAVNFYLRVEDLVPYNYSFKSLPEERFEAPLLLVAVLFLNGL